MCTLTNTSLIIYKQHQHIISVHKERLIVMAMASSTNLLHLLVLLLGLSHILCLNAVPVTSIESVVDQIRVRQVSENNHLVNAKKNPDGGIINPRMMPELNDYPGSGANNRHTPSKT